MAPFRSSGATAKTMASLLGFVAYHRYNKNLRTNWDSWKSKSDNLAMMVAEERFVPLPHVAAGLPCERRKTEMCFVPKPV